MPTVEQVGVCEPTTTETEMVGCPVLGIPTPVHLGAEIDLRSLDAFVTAAIVKGRIDLGAQVELSGIEAAAGLHVSSPTNLAVTFDVSKLEARAELELLEATQLGCEADISAIDARASLVGFPIEMAAEVNLGTLEASAALDVGRPVEMEVYADMADLDAAAGLEVGTREDETALRVQAGLDNFDAAASLLIGTPPAEALYLVANPPSRAAASGDVSFDITVQGGTGPYRYQRNSGPTWAAISQIGNNARVVASIPQSQTPGSYPIEIQVTDSLDATATATVTVTVVAASQAGLASSLSPGTVTATPGDTVSATMSATGGAGGNVFTKVSGPTWLSIGRLTGRVTGVVPQGAQSQSATFRVTDSAGATSTQTLTLAVGQASFIAGDARASSDNNVLEWLAAIGDYPRRQPAATDPVGIG